MRPYTRPMDELQPVALPPDKKTLYLSMQQEADFALWRAREANLALRETYARHVAGEGPPPPPEQLAQLAACERDAEAKYKALRVFLRGLLGAA